MAVSHFANAVPADRKRASVEAAILKDIKTALLLLIDGSVKFFFKHHAIEKVRDLLKVGIEPSRRSELVESTIAVITHGIAVMIDGLSIYQALRDECLNAEASVEMVIGYLDQSLAVKGDS